MEDKELLKLAAKAAGLNITSWNTQRGEAVAVIDGEWFWQPLLKNAITDCDGDALRLASKLEIDILFHVNVEAVTWALELNGDRHFYQEDGLSMRATRRAIVRAAAAIGKAMP